jgi:hypothetical protein
MKFQEISRLTTDAMNKIIETVRIMPLKPSFSFRQDYRRDGEIQITVNRSVIDPLTDKILLSAGTYLYRAESLGPLQEFINS